MSSKITGLNPRTFDLVVWGCTGFTGQLTLEYLSKTYPEMRIALGGRNEKKLLELRSRFNLGDQFGIITADIANLDSLDLMTRQTKVILSTAGPYALIGSGLVESCVRSKTHYCDLTGEPQWIRSMIDQHHETAKAGGVKIVNCCGFDCIPSDMGTFMMVRGMKLKNLKPLEVRLLASTVKGGFSGGTIASALNMFESTPIEKLMALTDPYCLAPRDETTKVPIRPTDASVIDAAKDNMVLGYDKIFKTWTMPYIMQGIDTRLVNRSNALAGWPYGQNFLYSERMRAPNVLVALVTTLVMPIVGILLFVPFTRNFIKSWLPKPGEYSSDLSLLDTGYFKMKLWGRGAGPGGNEELNIGEVIALNGDPGYRQTSRMIAESAVCLALDADKTPEEYGVLTPSVAFGSTIIRRLQARGFQFNLDGKPFEG